MFFPLNQYFWSTAKVFCHANSYFLLELLFCETLYLESKVLIQTEEEEGQISSETFSCYKFYCVISQFIVQYLKAVAFFFFLCFCAQNSCPGKGQKGPF